MNIALDDHELVLINDALARAASRYESMVNFRPRSKHRPEHAKTAAAMRQLRSKLARSRMMATQRTQPPKQC